jgi:hypothetical protein
VTYFPIKNNINIYGTLPYPNLSTPKATCASSTKPQHLLISVCVCVCLSTCTSSLPLSNSVHHASPHVNVALHLVSFIWYVLLNVNWGVGLQEIHLLLAIVDGGVEVVSTHAVRADVLFLEVKEV